jgi:hypothetical protein
MKIRRFVVLLSSLVLLLVPATAFAASPAQTMIQPAVIMNVGSPTISVISLNNGVPAHQELVLNAPLVNVGGTLYLDTESLNQVIGLYGGTAVASSDGAALSMTIGNSTAIAVAGQNWIIRINNEMVYPIWLGSYGGTPYVSGQTSYWPVGDLYWLLLKNGQIQVNATGSGVTLYVTPTSKG